MYRTLFANDFFSQLDRMQRELWPTLDFPPSIRGSTRAGYPAINIGRTPNSLEIYAFAPGFDANALEVFIEEGVLTIAGERKAPEPDPNTKPAVHFNERFQGGFRRVIALPDDINPDSVSAAYRDGVLHITLQRREAFQPRRINVQ